MTDARTLTAALGGRWRGRSGSAPCPVCQPERRRDQHALSLRDDGGRLLAYCHKTNCAFADIARAAGMAPEAMRPDPFAQARDEARRAAQASESRAWARKLWDAASPLSGTLGETYLRGRGITAPLPPSLRFLPDARHAPSAANRPAMLADVAPTGGVHRTFLTPGGERLAKHGKLMLGPCGGGAVRLSEGDGLVVCEGIETGLSLLSGLLRGAPAVWAALSTSGVRGLDLPPTPGVLTIAADGDVAGLDAAYALAERAHGLGWSVRLLPAPDGRDWNDVLMLGGAA